MNNRGPWSIRRLGWRIAGRVLFCVWIQQSRVAFAQAQRIIGKYFRTGSEIFPAPGTIPKVTNATMDRPPPPAERLLINGSRCQSWHFNVQTATFCDSLTFNETMIFKKISWMVYINICLWASWKYPSVTLCNDHSTTDKLKLQFMLDAEDRWSLRWWVDTFMTQTDANDTYSERG